MAGTAYIYDEESWSRDFPQSFYMAWTAYIYEKKCWFLDFPWSPYMACTAYIYDEKSWSRDFPQSLYMACTAYIYIWRKMLLPKLPFEPLTWPVQPIYLLNKFAPETSPLCCTFPVQPIYMWWKMLLQRLPLHNIWRKKLVPRFPFESLHGVYTLYIWWNIWSLDFPWSPYMACTAYIYDEENWSRDFPQSFYVAWTAYIYDENSQCLDFS
jgi:hypothetical protein